MKQSAYVPHRRCVSCKVTAPKKSMLRVMRHRDLKADKTTAVVDMTQKGAGRGAYVCSMACLEKACRSHAFDRALKIKISNESLERIKEQGKLLF